MTIINKRKKKTELIISEELSKSFENNDSDSKSSDKVNLDKIFQYHPMRQAIGKFYSGSEDKIVFAQLLKFNSLYPKFIFQGNGNLYVNSYNTSGTQIRLRDGYFWGSHNFCTQNFDVIHFIARCIKQLDETQKHNYVSSLIIQIANSINKKFDAIYENIETYNSLKQFMSYIYNLLILPHKETLMTQLTSESSKTLSQALWIFTVLGEEEFNITVNTLTLKENRQITKNYLINDSNGDILKLKYLLVEFTGWDNLDLMKDVLLQKNILDSDTFKELIKNFDLSKMHLFFIENRKSFLKNNMTVSGFVYYIKTLCGGLNKDTIDIVSGALQRNLVKYELLEAEGLAVSEYISNNPELFSRESICSMIISENIKLTINDEQRINLVKVFSQKFTGIGLFQKFIVNNIGVDKFLELYPQIIEDRTTYQKIHSNFMEFFRELSDKTFLDFITKNIKKFNQQNITINRGVIDVIYSRVFDYSQCNNSLYEAVVELLNTNGWFDNPLTVVACEENKKVIRNDYVRNAYVSALIKKRGLWNTMETLFDIKELTHSSSTHKHFFYSFVNALKHMNKEDVYQKHFIDLRKGNPLHSFLNRITNFYLIEDGAKAALTKTDHHENVMVWQELDKLLTFFNNYFGLAFLQQADNEGVYIRDKFLILDGATNLGKNEAPAINVSNFRQEQEVSFKSRLMFWKKEEFEAVNFDYLYISPQGPLLSNEVLEAFIELNTTNESWKNKHEDNTKKVYALLQIGNIPTDISLEAKELIRNFKNIAENLEPIKEQLEFEEQMFFEQSFFNDLIDMLNAHNNGVGNLKIMKNISPEQHQELIIKSQENCLRIMNMLKNQMDNISNDIFKNLVHKSNFDLEVLAEYVKSRSFGKSSI